MNIIKVNKTIINLNNVFYISTYDNKIEIQGNYDKKITFHCENEEQAKNDFDRIFEEWQK